MVQDFFGVFSWKITFVKINPHEMPKPLPKLMTGKNIVAKKRSQSAIQCPPLVEPHPPPPPPHSPFTTPSTPSTTNWILFRILPNCPGYLQTDINTLNVNRVSFLSVIWLPKTNFGLLIKRQLMSPVVNHCTLSSQTRR